MLGKIKSGEILYPTQRYLPLAKFSLVEKAHYTVTYELILAVSFGSPWYLLHLLQKNTRKIWSKL